MADAEALEGVAEAVAIGIAIDSVYASLAMGLRPAEAARVLLCLARLGFDLDHPQLGDLPQLLTGLEEFRQHLGGRLTLTMLKRIGRPVNVHQIDRELMRRAVEQVRQYGQFQQTAQRATRLPEGEENCWVIGPDDPRRALFPRGVAHG